MTDFLWVGLGGFVGANARYALGTLILARFGSDFPWHTLLVNLTGSFFIGVIMTVLLERSLVDSPVRLLVVVGFLGGYTTFSSYTHETIMLIERGEWNSALLYGLGSNVIGLLATLGGMALVRSAIR